MKNCSQTDYPKTVRNRRLVGSRGEPIAPLSLFRFALHCCQLPYLSQAERKEKFYREASQIWPDYIWSMPTASTYRKWVEIGRGAGSGADGDELLAQAIAAVEART